MIRLKVLADEYAKTIKALLSNEYYLAKHKKDTFAQLISAYKKLAAHFSSEGPSADVGARAKKSALYRTIETLKQEILNAKEDESDIDAQWTCDLEEKKAIEIETLLKADGIEPMVTLKAVEFRNGKGVVILAIPVSTEKKQNVGAEAAA